MGVWLLPVLLRVRSFCSCCNLCIGGTEILCAFFSLGNAFKKRNWLSNTLTSHGCKDEQRIFAWVLLLPVLRGFEAGFAAAVIVSAIHHINESSSHHQHDFLSNLPQICVAALVELRSVVLHSSSACRMHSKRIQTLTSRDWGLKRWARWILCMVLLLPVNEDFCSAPCSCSLQSINPKP